MKKFLSLMTSLVMMGILIFSNPVKSQAASNFNYGEALQKSIMFYEFQMAGKLPENIRNNWRGDSALSDGADVGLDLTGGWFDAGDHVKFNLPMAYTGTMLGWSYLESKDVFQSTGQDTYMLQQLKWVNDYFIRCNPEKGKYCFQVGSGGADHAFWGPAEVMQMARPSYIASGSRGAGAACSEAAASLAVASKIFAGIDSEFAADCLKHSKWLFEQAEANPNDSYYNSVAGSFYKSWSGCYDELSWAAVWLYKVTGDDTYLAKAEQYAQRWGTEPQSTTIAYKWSQCWDDVHYGTCLLLADITKNASYKDNIERHLDYWTTGADGNPNNRIKYTPKGMAWLDTWGSLRYATTTAFLAAVYSDMDVCSTGKVSIYSGFAKSQADYALGSSGRSYVCGFGVNPPQNPHHRTAHAGWENNCGGLPTTNRHVLYGALVGGPNISDGYKDDRTDYVANEVACDYNAGFTGLLAKLCGEYGGTPIADFNAVEEIGDECYLETCINAKNTTGDKNFVEFKTVVYNKTAWPARITDKLSFRVFVDLTYVYANGYTYRDMNVISNYNQAGAVITSLKAWDAADNIYYFDVDFTGKKLYPGGSEAYKKEIQFRVEAPCKWDFSTSYSVLGLNDTSMVKTENMPLYDGGKLIFGKEPDYIPAQVPVVSITKPVNNEVFSNVSQENPVIIKADASVADSTITKVEFYNGATKIATDTTAPYECAFVPEALPQNAGLTKSFDLTAKAYSAKGTNAVSEKVTVKIEFPELNKPVVQITSPIDGDVFESVSAENPVIIEADASIEDSNITKVEFYNDGKFISSDTTAPYKASFNPSSFSVLPGEIQYFNIVAKAYGANGTSKESEPVSVGIKVKENQYPVVEIVEPLDGVVFENVSSTNPIVIKADASVDGSTIKTVEFFKNGVRVSSDDASPYTYTFVPTFNNSHPGDIIEYSFAAYATAENGLSTVSENVTVFVKVPEEVAPVVSILTPTDGAEYPEGTSKITVSANASITGDGTIKRVEFYADGILFASKTAKPYTADYTDIGYAENEGDFKDVVFTVKAISSNDVVTESEPVAVRVYLKEKPIINSDITVDVNNSSSVNTNTIYNKFIITKNSGEDLDVSKLMIKYYYTADSEQSQIFNCDNCGVQHKVSPWYSAITGSVNANIVKLENPFEMADYCLQVTFNDTNALLYNGSKMIIDTRIYKDNWSNYNQSNDYSYQDVKNICIYYDGELIFGNELS